MYVNGFKQFLHRGSNKIFAATFTKGAICDESKGRTCVVFSPLIFGCPAPCACMMHFNVAEINCILACKCYLLIHQRHKTFNPNFDKYKLDIKAIKTARIKGYFEINC